ncbi:MAG: helix-turn-helix domain-containing protein [Candidatus Altiarchaeota archaeon]
MNLEILEKIGLSKAEVRVYVTLLELGSTPSSRVVDETGFRKSTVYESIRRLQERGLVSYVIKDKRRYYEAQNPDRLVDFLDDRRKELEEYEVDVRKIIPKLKKGFDLLKPHAEAHVLAGIEGFKTMRDDVLKNADKGLLLIGAISKEGDVMPGFFRNWNEARQIKKIHMRVLNKESSRQKAMAKKEFMGEYFNMRFLPEELESPAVINIYGDRVVNVLWKKKHPLCFMLINSDIADSYRKYFEYLWKKAAEK